MGERDIIEQPADSERAAIVAWLRREFQDDGQGAQDLAHWIADAIERGDHIRPTTLAATEGL